MLWLLIACGNPKNPVECANYSGIRIDDQTIHLQEDACSSVELNPAVLGSGEMEVQWSQDGNTLTPTITANVDSTFEGLVLTGTYSLQGSETTPGNKDTKVGGGQV